MTHWARCSDHRIKGLTVINIGITTMMRKYNFGFELILFFFNGFYKVKQSNRIKTVIRKVAVSGGAGSFLISKALVWGADAFVTSDIKYHEFFAAAGQMLLCDIGHYESEQFTMDLFMDILLQKFPTFAVLKSEVRTNPVHYFTGNKRKSGITHG